ncbi:stomatin (EPB72)-like 3a [Oncorhynchus clarkii lewisi]|uniref:stomatin (EPB72)-like 3a n=1 Tax=Oncorhynchus clarkii lewisi TaxID=490388 RepID=UPI0039B8E32F
MVNQGKVQISSSTEQILEDKSSGSLGCCGRLLFGISLIFTVFLFPIAIFMCVKIVKEYERAVIFRLGRIADKKPKGPGIFFVLPCTDTFVKVDLRTVSFDIPPQEILTKDSVTVSVDGVVYFSAVANVSNAHSSTRLLAQTTLRNVLGTKNLAELLSDREGISHNMQPLKIRMGCLCKHSVLKIRMGCLCKHSVLKIRMGCLCKHSVLKIRMGCLCKHSVLKIRMGCLCKHSHLQDHRPN